MLVFLMMVMIVIVVMVLGHGDGGDGGDRDDYTDHLRIQQGSCRTPFSSEASMHTKLLNTRPLYIYIYSYISYI